MERVLGLDVHAASCTFAVISQTGKRLTDFPIETNGHALVEAIRRIPGRKHLVFEEGIQSAWLYETLSPHVDEIVVAGIPGSRRQKSDRRDAYGLAEKLRTGALAKRIFKVPRESSARRELSRMHINRGARSRSGPSADHESLPLAGHPATRQGDGGGDARRPVQPKARRLPRPSRTRPNSWRTKLSATSSLWETGTNR